VVGLSLRALAYDKISLFASAAKRTNMGRPHRMPQDESCFDSPLDPFGPPISLQRPASPGIKCTWPTT